MSQHASESSETVGSQPAPYHHCAIAKRSVASTALLLEAAAAASSAPSAASLRDTRARLAARSASLAVERAKPRSASAGAPAAPLSALHAESNALAHVSSAESASSVVQ